VLAIDSLASMTPEKEIEDSVAKDHVAQQARVLGKGSRKFTAAVNSAGNNRGVRPTIFFVNQIRMQVGLMFGNPEIMPGGHAPQFLATTEVRFEPGKFQIDEESKRPLFGEMRFKIIKNKSAPPKMEGNYKLMLSPTEYKKVGDVFDEDQMVATAERYGLVEKKGANYTCLGEKYDSLSAIEARAVRELGFKETLRSALLQVLGLIP